MTTATALPALIAETRTTLEVLHFCTDSCRALYLMTGNEERQTTYALARAPMRERCDHCGDPLHD
jgi:hypothetical protein